MAEPRDYAPGTPSWVDLETPDLDAATTFYGALFGWEIVDQGEEAGHYSMCLLRGLPVAGMGPQMNPGPPHWTTYISVADADAAATAIRDAGGTVFVGPMDVMDVGRMVVFADTEGALCAAWQPRAHKGAGIVNEPGSLCWNELASRDTSAAKRFYGAVFGWGANTSPGPPMEYTEWTLGDRNIGGMMLMGDHMPADIPPHWLAYFAVDDCDASVTKITELGGAVDAGPMEIPAGRFAACADPHGAMFGIVALSAEAAERGART
jgi:predicted enzyme related to lactoylglutathione lyase